MTVILTDGIPQVVNYGFAYTDANTNIYNHPTWILDWETPLAAIVTAEALNAGIEGNFYDSDYGEEFPTATIPVMPYKLDTQSGGFQMFVSDFTVDSIFHSMLEEESLGGWFLSTEVPATAGWQLDTGFLNKFLPGLSATYGPDQPCDIHFQITELGDFVSSEVNQNVALVGDIVLQVWVHTVEGTKVEACSLLLQQVAYQGSLSVGDAGYGVALQIQQVNVDKIVVQYSAIGFISAVTLKVELNNGFRLF